MVAIEHIPRSLVHHANAEIAVVPSAATRVLRSDAAGIDHAPVQKVL